MIDICKRLKQTTGFDEEEDLGTPDGFHTKPIPPVHKKLKLEDSVDVLGSEGEEATDKTPKRIAHIPRVKTEVYIYFENFEIFILKILF